MILLLNVGAPLEAAFRAWAEPRGLSVVSLHDSEIGTPAETPRLCVLEARSDEAVGKERIRAVRKSLRGGPLVVVARTLSIDAVAALMREGVADVIGLGSDVESIVSRATLHAADPGGRDGSHDLVGQTPVIRRLREEIVNIAPMQSTVLITGETGVGKGIVARLIHGLSGRSEQSLVHVDCGALAPSLIESELFGHERGAFTGAVGRRLGRFELAGRGTVFLDEIGELSAETQTKLLRVLQERTFERIGGSEPRAMRARIIAATNRDLWAEAQAGRFRSDLYFRLAVFEVRVPPLRERLDDLPLLVQSELEQLSSRLCVPLPPLDPSFCEVLSRHDWPGNVRELFNVLERTIVRARGNVLDATSLARLHWIPQIRPRLAGEARPFVAQVPIEEGEDESRRIGDVLVATGGNVARAARRLGIPRGTLRYRIERLGLGHLILKD